MNKPKYKQAQGRIDFLGLTRSGDNGCVSLRNRMLYRGYIYFFQLKNKYS